MEEILTRYNNYREEIQEYMKFFVSNLQDKYGEISESFVVSLDLLAMNLEVLFNARDEMKDKGLTENDKYHGEKKSGSLQAFFNAQNYIHKLIASFGFTPMSKSKIKDNTDVNDVQKYLESLTN